ncbi:hypothetical protein [Sphingomonas soli]|nr:hypothetical protein [Sphingomonas soli]
MFGREVLTGLLALDQVTGWSKADAEKEPHDATRALFGGWRVRGG